MGSDQSKLDHEYSFNNILYRLKNEYNIQISNMKMTHENVITLLNHKKIDKSIKKQLIEIDKYYEFKTYKKFNIPKQQYNEFYEQSWEFKSGFFSGFTHGVNYSGQKLGS